MHRYSAPPMQRQGWGQVLFGAVISAAVIGAGNTVVCIYQMRYLIPIERNLVLISTKLALIGQLSQFQNLSIGRNICGAILLYICISLVIQRLRRHYTLTGLRDNVLFLCTVDVTGQRRDQQSCQDRQDDQDYDQLYQRKAALSAAP